MTEKPFLEKHPASVFLKEKQWKDSEEHGIKTQGITSFFFLSRSSFMYLMAPINFIKCQNNMRRVTWGPMHRLKIKIHIPYRTKNCRTKSDEIFQRWRKFRLTKNFVRQKFYAKLKFYVLAIFDRFNTFAN